MVADAADRYLSHGFCAAKFACVGCAGKVPDPAKRPQIDEQPVGIIRSPVRAIALPASARSQ